MLTVCLGLTLALAFIVETEPRKPAPIDPGGAVAPSILLAYIAFRYPKSAARFRRCCVAGLGAQPWPGPCLGSRAARSRAGSTGSAASPRSCICGYIAVRYEPLTYEIAMLPLEGIVGSAILIFLVLEAAAAPPAGASSRIILAMAVYIYISPHLPGDFQTRYVSPERLVVYLGLDINGIDRLDPAGRGADRHPVHDPGPGAGAHRRRRLLRRSRDVGDGPLSRRRGQDRGGRLRRCSA